MKLSVATTVCKRCFAPIQLDNFHALISKPSLCEKCYQELDPKFIRFKVNGIRAIALYEYNQTVQSLLFQFKGCYDIELAPTFFEYAKPFLKLRYHAYSIIPAPSSANHDLARGFNHVEEMGKSLGLPLIKALKKTDDIKQSDLSAEERKKVKERIAWIKGKKIQGKKILLLDDVYTTGSTMKACLALVLAHHPSKVEILVMAKTSAPKKPSKGER